MKGRFMWMDVHTRRRLRTRRVRRAEAEESTSTHSTDNETNKQIDLIERKEPKAAVNRSVFSLDWTEVGIVWSSSEEAKGGFTVFSREQPVIQNQLVREVCRVPAGQDADIRCLSMIYFYIVNECTRRIFFAFHCCPLLNIIMCSK